MPKGAITMPALDAASARFWMPYIAAHMVAHKRGTDRAR